VRVGTGSWVVDDSVVAAHCHRLLNNDNNNIMSVSPLQAAYRSLHPVASLVSYRNYQQIFLSLASREATRRLGPT